MVTPMRVDGADISHHQSGDLDFREFKSAGGKFLYHKATEGATFKDKNYNSRRLDAKLARLPFGAYHFARPERGDAVREARFFIQVADPRPGDLCPALDLEVNDGNLSKAELTTWVGNFLQEVQRLVGVECVIYTPYELDNYYRSMIWRPRYNDGNKPPVLDWDIWQFSDGRLGVPDRVNGLGHVDLNVLAKDVRVRDFTITVGGQKKDSMSRTGTFRITTQNVQALPEMPQPDVVHDVRMTARQSGVIGWQEITPERYDDAVQKLEEEGNWETFWGQGKARKGLERADEREPVGYDTPISWRAKYWKFQEGGKWLLFEGEAKISKPRWLTWVRLEHRRTGAQVMFVNVHFISKAWSDKPAHRKDERPEMWRKAWRALVDWLSEMIDEFPEMAICLMGDFNAKLNRDAHAFDPSSVARRRIRGTFPNAIDHLFFINGRKYKWIIEETEIMPGRRGDHQGRRAVVRLSWSN